MTNHNPTLNKRVLYMFKNPLEKIIGTSLYSCLNKYTISEIDHKNFNSNLIFIQRNKLGYSLTSACGNKAELPNHNCCILSYKWHTTQNPAFKHAVVACKMTFDI